MKIYYAVLATALVAASIIGGFVLLKNFHNASNSLRDMADAEKAEKKTDTFTIPPDSEDNSGTGTVTNDPATFAQEHSDEEKLQIAKVRDEQTKRLLNLGYHRSAGLSEQEFAALVPIPDPPAGGTDALLVVNERFVGIFEQCRLLGVNPNPAFDLEEHWNLREPPEEKMYWRYGLDNGMRDTLGFSVDAARAWMDDHKRRPATTVEVLALYAQYNDILGKVFLDAAGSGYSRGRTPHLCRRDDGQVELAMALTNRGHRQWSSPSFNNK